MAPSLKDFYLRDYKLPNNGGTFQSPAPIVQGTTNPMPQAEWGNGAPVYQNPLQTGGGVTPTKPVFTGTLTPPVTTSNTTSTQTQTRSKYINPATGEYFKTAEEYGNYVGNQLPNMKGTGDIPQYAGDVLVNQARNLNNARNDIATGTTDPYDFTKGGEITFSPQDLQAIEKAYAGIYDPALNDVFNRLKTREEEKAAALELQNKLSLMEKQQQYDLQLKQTPTYSDLNSANNGDYNLTSKQQSQLLNITNKYSADATINQGLSAVQIKNITKAINENPQSAGNQLIALYTLVKNLDPDTAVREGELTLASKTNTYLGKFQDSLRRIATGRVLNPAAIKELTAATDLLANEWVTAAQRRQKQYSSQADVFGLSQPFNGYVGGFQNPDTMGSGALPSTMILNGQTLYLQADGTYE